ncbi:MAG: SusF/SusE family outer membrane protein [Bacteroidales bacterium]|nr:SusF/SusE family outer membrane protein [Bacteroidales bacterium]
MKKIFSYAMMLVAGSLAFISCDKDDESNPILVKPAEGSFTVNTPVYGNAQIDLMRSNTVAMSWSQPQFTDPNAPVVANYQVQVSSTGSFTKAFDEMAEDNTGADYFALDETYTACEVNVPTSAIDRALELLNGWDNTNSVFSEGATVYARVLAFVQNASFDKLATVASNVVTFNVLPYYIELKAADPDIWYLIGGDIGDGKWTSDMPTSSYPMHTVADWEYDTKTGAGVITWTGYLAGNGFKLKHTLDSWDEQWGQGDSFGSFVKNDGGSGNITVPEPGYYTVTLNTEKDELTVEKYEGTPTVFPGMCIAGHFNEWGDTEMKPVHTYDGAINHDWVANVTIGADQAIKIKEPGSWDYNSGGDVFETADGSYYGYGTNGGADIFLTPGNYLVIYNDITRFYRFVLQ